MSAGHGKKTFSWILKNCSIIHRFCDHLHPPSSSFSLEPIFSLMSKADRRTWWDQEPQRWRVWLPKTQMILDIYMLLTWAIGRLVRSRIYIYIYRERKQATCAVWKRNVLMQMYLCIIQPWIVGPYCVMKGKLYGSLTIIKLMITGKKKGLYMERPQRSSGLADRLYRAADLISLSLNNAARRCALYIYCFPKP